MQDDKAQKKSQKKKKQKKAQSSISAADDEEDIDEEAESQRIFAERYRMEKLQFEEERRLAESKGIR